MAGPTHPADGTMSPFAGCPWLRAAAGRLCDAAAAVGDGAAVVARGVAGWTVVAVAAPVAVTASWVIGRARPRGPAGGAP